MPHIGDLEACSALPVQSPALVAIGWLSPNHDFPRGKAPNGFFEKLEALCSDPWEPFAAGGSHQCELCQYQGPRFSTNLFIPAGKRIFVAPAGVAHYVAAHWYLPPRTFIDAVLSCPPVRSMEYKKAILAGGGRQLIAASAA
jgi:hypothetical protein